MSKTLWVGVVGAMLLVASAWLAFQESGEDTQSPVPPASVADTLPAPPSGDSTNPLAGLPEFDVVRVSRDGSAVIAGRAVPASQITVFNNRTVLGQLTADENGEWVFLTEAPMDVGEHLLIVRMRTPDGREKESSSALVVSIPDSAEAPEVSSVATAIVKLEQGESADRADNGQSAHDSGQDILVAKVARQGLGASEVLQGVGQDGGLQSPTGALTLDTIDYNLTGHVVLSGQTMAGSTVHAFLDDIHIGATEATQHGRWIIAPPQPVEQGIYELRIEQHEHQLVTGRIVLPFHQTTSGLTLSEVDTVVVQPGHNLWRIARATLGKGTLYTLIFENNKAQIHNPDLIYPGQVLEIPPSQQR